MFGIGAKRGWARKLAKNAGFARKLALDIHSYGVIKALEFDQ